MKAPLNVASLLQPGLGNVVLVHTPNSVYTTGTINTTNVVWAQSKPALRPIIDPMKFFTQVQDEA